MQPERTCSVAVQQWCGPACLSQTAVGLPCWLLLLLPQWLLLLLLLLCRLAEEATLQATAAATLGRLPCSIAAAAATWCCAWPWRETGTKQTGIRAWQNNYKQRDYVCVGVSAR
jgi:hypothetical protein